MSENYLKYFDMQIAANMTEIDYRREGGGGKLFEIESRSTKSI